MKTPIFYLGIIIVLQSCKFSPDEITLPNWKSEWLAPISKTTLSPQDIQGVDSIHFEHGFSANDLGMPLGTYPMLPAITGLNISQSVTTSNIYYEVTFDSALGKIKIINSMPFTIKAGTKITLDKNNNVLFSFTINNDVAPNTTFQSPDIDFAGKKLYNQIDVKLENLSTNAVNNSVTISGNERITIQFDIINLQLRELAVEANNQFEVVDTTDFTFAGDEMAAKAVNGKLKIFIENQFPIQQTIQAYFMDSLFNVVDSLFTQPFVIFSAHVDAQGYSNDKPLSSAEIILNAQKFNNLKNAKFLKAKAVFQNINNTVSLVRMRRTDSFDIQVVGDLQLQYDLNQKEQ